MKIVIIGDGKVGFKLAKQLSEENFDVVMIDNDSSRLETANNTLDVFYFLFNNFLWSLL